MDGNQNLITENIDEVILRLLKLDPGTEIDYQIYFKKILNRIAIDRGIVPGVKNIPAEEIELLREELKRVKKLLNKGRFVIKEKKVKVSSGAESSPKSEFDDSSGRGNIPKSGAIVKSPSGKLSTEKFLYQPKIEEVNVRDITEKTKDNSNLLKKISQKLDSILESLNNIFNYNKSEFEKKRRSTEQSTRSSREKELEFRPVEGIKKVISAITKPFQSIWDKIVNFITSIILGRIVIKLIDWIADPNNQDKINSIIRFLKDNWPLLLTLYLRFGTSIGRFIGSLTGVLVKGSLRLIQITANLAAKMGLKGAGKVGKFLGGPKGRLLGAGLTIGANVVGMMAASGFAKDFLGGGKSESSNGSNASGGVPAFSGGGWSGGLKNFFGNMFEGLIKGPGGPKGDKIPAMLSDGEFVMSAGAVQKYGVDTLEAMNAAGGGTNVPVIKSDGMTYASGGGPIGDIPMNVPINWLTSNMSDEGAKSLAQTYSTLGSNSLGLTSDEWYKAIKRYKGVPDFDRILGKGKPFTKWESVNKPLSKEHLDTIRKIVRGNRPGSAYSTPSPISGSQRPQLRQTGSELRTTRIDPSRMLPSAGQSSANMMRAAERTARVSRSPIPASRAIVPYSGGGLVRSGVTAGLSESIPQIRTNMRVPGGFGGSTLVGGLKTAGIEMLASYLMDRGFDKVNAMIIASKIDKGKKLTGNKRENYIERLRNIVDREERWQKGTGGLFDKIINLGKETGSEKISKNARAILEGLGSNAYQGGELKGGYGLKEQTFKDAPKTSIITDEKGRPYVGHKALKNGKIVYVRKPQPGTGTTNPLEMLGRMINPGAYRDSDKLGAMKNQKIAMVNALEMFQEQEMAPDAQARMIKQMGGNLKDVQNDLDYRRKIRGKSANGKLDNQQRFSDARSKQAGARAIGRYYSSSDGKYYGNYQQAVIARNQRRRASVTPLPRPRPRPQVAGGGMGGRRGSGSNPSNSGSRPPSLSATHRRGTTNSAATYGIRR